MRGSRAALRSPRLAPPGIAVTRGLAPRPQRVATDEPGDAPVPSYGRPRRVRWRRRASRARGLALGGQQAVQLAHLALVAGAGAFGPKVVVHGVESDGE